MGAKWTWPGIGRRDRLRNRESGGERRARRVPGMMAVVLGLGLTGLVVLAIGVVANWPAFSAGRGLSKLVALGRPFEGAALAAFGAEHLFGAQLVVGGVPRYMPWPLFWAYLVGVALVAAGLSIA